MRQHKNVRIKDSMNADAESMELVEGLGIELQFFDLNCSGSLSAAEWLCGLSSSSFYCPFGCIQCILKKYCDFTTC